MKSDVQQRRLAAAIAIVACALALVPVSGAVFVGLQTSQPAIAADDQIRASEIVDERDAQGTLSRMEELAQAGKRPAPEFFEAEIGFLAGARDVRISGAGHVVGYLVDGDCEETLESVRGLMARSRWAEVSLGEVRGATFVKKGGVCTWTLVTCTQIGSATAVVYRCVIQ